MQSISQLLVSKLCASSRIPTPVSSFYHGSDFSVMDYNLNLSASYGV